MRRSSSSSRWQTLIGFAVAFIAVISLIWAIVLSLYISKEWNDFSILQRES